MTEPQTTPQEGDTSHFVETSPLEQAGRNEAEQLHCQHDGQGGEHRGGHLVG